MTLPGPHQYIWWKLVLLCGDPITYYYGRKSTVALGTATAETIALIKLVVKIKYLRALMHLHCCQNRKTAIESTFDCRCTCCRFLE